MNQKSYNIFGELRQNIDDFDTKGVYIVGKPSPKDYFALRPQFGRYGGYYFSQRQMLEAIELACASKYKTGQFDADGKKKTYINIVNFHADVSLNQIKLGVSDYILSPVDLEDQWPIFFMDKRFREWAQENNYDDLIDEQADDFVRKGSVVVKKIPGRIPQRVPLRSLRCTQTAKSLKQAATSGGYVIIENEISYNEMMKYKGWNLTGVDKGKSHLVFERYSLIPRAKLLEQQKIKPTSQDWEDRVLAVQILLPNEKSLKDEEGNESGHILFLEALDEDEWIFEEAHYNKQDGRWLGVGEVEKQLENQIARNLTANLRRKGLAWAAKRIFQSTDPDIKRNLQIEVKDGEVLEIGQNGNVTPVNTQNLNLADFTADENMWKENSQQISFSFEAATGENLPSNTPFSLGVIMQQAVSKYFKRKQNTLSYFLKRSFFHQIIPIFKSEHKTAHTLMYGTSDDNYDQVREAMITIQANQLVKKSWLQNHFISFDDAHAKIEAAISRSPLLAIKIPDDFYEEPECYMKLNLTDPIAADVESLTSLYQILSKNGDPRADRVLQLILSTKGKSPAYILGPTPKAPLKSPIQPQDQETALDAAKGGPEEATE